MSIYINERRAPPDLAFGHFDYDRDEHFREDPALLDVAWTSEAARTFVICGENIVLKKDEPLDPLFRLQDLPDAMLHRERAFIGKDGEAPRFALLLANEASETLQQRNDLALIGLRQLAMDSLLSPSHLSALAAAKALMFWHSTHRFCSACGQASQASQGGWRRDCPSCKAQHFPRTDPVVIMLAVKGEKCLLGRQSRFPPGMYSCLAGFCEPGETIEDAVRRELFEEAGVKTERVRYLASQPWPFPESLMIGCIAEAVTDEITPDTTELEDARWFSREEALQILRREHPAGVAAPGRIAIARVLLKAWARDGAGF